MSKERWGTLVTVISGATFGTLAIFAKLAYAGGANIPTVLFLRFLGAALIFWLYLFAKNDLKPFNRETTIKLLIMGSLGYGSMSALFMLSVARIPAALAGMLLYLYPALVTLVTVVRGQERFTARKGLALAVTSIGLFLVLGGTFDNVDLLGVVFGLLAAAVYTTYIVAGSKVLEALEPVKATTYIMSGSVIAYSVFAVVSGALTFNFQPVTWLVIVGIILIPTVAAILTFWLGVQMIGPSKASIISTVEPLFTVLLAWLIFGELLSVTQLVGGSLILLGVFILQYPLETRKSQAV